jgi:hypothetical protein
MELFAFLQGVFEKMGGKTWFFSGAFVVESWWLVVNLLALF